MRCAPPSLPPPSLVDVCVDSPHLHAQVPPDTFPWLRALSSACDTPKHLLWMGSVLSRLSAHIDWERLHHVLASGHIIGHGSDVSSHHEKKVHFEGDDGDQSMVVRGVCSADREQSHTICASLPSLRGWEALWLLCMAHTNRYQLFYESVVLRVQ